VDVEVAVVEASGDGGESLVVAAFGSLHPPRARRSREAVPSVALYTIACVPGTDVSSVMALAVVVAPPSTDALMPRLRSSEGR